MNDKLCESCGNKIPKARVQAIPNVEYCVACASDIEQKYGIEIPIDDYVDNIYTGDGYT